MIYDHVRAGNDEGKARFRRAQLPPLYLIILADQRAGGASEKLVVRGREPREGYYRETIGNSVVVYRKARGRKNPGQRSPERGSCTWENIKAHQPGIQTKRCNG